MKNKNLIIGITSSLAVLAIIIGIIVGVSGKSKSTQDLASKKGKEVQTERAFPVLVKKLEQSEILDYLKLNGDITTDVDVDIYPDVAGKIIEVYKEIGDVVQKGDILMRVDPSVPGMKYQPNPVRSTISGTVTARYAQLGGTVSPQQPVFKVGIIDELRIISHIPERFIARVKPNLTTNVFVDAYPNRVFKATIIDISPVVDPISRTMKVKMKLVGNTQGLRPGMYASMQIIDQVKNNALVVPIESIVRRYSSQYVFVIDEEGKARQSEVTTGISIDGRVEILSGLELGQFYVVSGQSLLDDGMKVNIINDDEYDELKNYIKKDNEQESKDIVSDDNN